MLICCCSLKRVVNSCCSCCPYACLPVCRSVYVSTVPLTWFCPVFRKQTSLACSLPRGPNTQKCRHIQQPHFSWTVDVENLKKKYYKNTQANSAQNAFYTFSYLVSEYLVVNEAKLCTAIVKLAEWNSLTQLLSSQPLSQFLFRY